MDINEMRHKIDKIDTELLKLLNERLRLSVSIGRNKSTHGKSIFLPERESTIIRQLERLNKGPLPREALMDIFREILNVSRNLQKRIKVAYLGPPATFTHSAAIVKFGRRAELVPEPSITDVFREVEKTLADYGVVPVENSAEGMVTHTLDMLMDSDLKICAEIVLKVSHCLLSRLSTVTGIKKLYANSQAYAQCRDWVSNHLPNVPVVEVASTSESARRAHLETGAGAIASREAATTYEMNILAQGIEDTRDNITRFLVIGRQSPAASGDDKTSILFSTKDRVGALYDMLKPFRKHNINLTKIESRPTGRKAWEYVFFVDFIGHQNDQKIRIALKELQSQCEFVKILGSYPREKCRQHR